MLIDVYASQNNVVKFNFPKLHLIQAVISHVKDIAGVTISNIFLLSSHAENCKLLEENINF